MNLMMGLLLEYINKTDSYKRYEQEDNDGDEKNDDEDIDDYQDDEFEDVK